MATITELLAEIATASRLTYISHTKSEGGPIVGISHGGLPSPRVRSTLLLRLMGSRGTLRQAVNALATKYARSWEAAAIFPVIDLLHLTYREKPTQFEYTNLRDLEDVMNVFERAEKYRNEMMLAGTEKGTIVGERDSLRIVLSARAFVLAPTHESLIESCGDLATIQRWIRNAVTARSLDEVFGSAPTE